MQDPLAELNARLRKLGLQPISLGGAPARPDIAAMYQRPISKASPVETQQAIAKQAGPMYNQLTPEAEAGVMEKIGGGMLSGLEWLGRTIDSATGARAIRGVLGGNFREALSAGPLGLVSDAIGLTDPKDIVGGRELMEKAGILGENQEGLDWGDVGGFAAEVLLDPSTYFFGAGLATKGASAATKVGKAFNKVGVLDDVLKRASTDDKLLEKLLAGAAGRGDKVAAKTLEDIALGAAKKGSGIRMGQRQIGRRITADDVLSLDDEITAALASQGKQSLGEVESLSQSFRGLNGKSVREVLEGSVGGADELKKLMKDEWVLPDGGAMPMTSHWSMGFPTLFTGKEGTKGIRRTVFDNLPPVMTRKQYFPSLDKGFGKNIDAFAGRIDVAGDIMRFGKLSPMRGLATLFNPNLQWDARTALAQRGILNNISKGERRIKEVNTMLFDSESTLRKNDFLDKQAYMDQFGMSEEMAEEAVSRGTDDLGSYLEGYGVEYIDGVDGNKVAVPILPTHDIKQAPKIRRIAEVNYFRAKTYYNTITRQLDDTTKLEPRALKQAEKTGPEALERATRDFVIEKEALVRAQNEAGEMGTEWETIMNDLDVMLDVEGGGKNATYSNLIEQSPGVPVEDARRLGNDNAQGIILRMKELQKKFKQSPPEGIPTPGAVDGYLQEIEVHDFLKLGSAKTKIKNPWFDVPKGGVHDRSLPQLSESLQKLPGELGTLDDKGVTLFENTIGRVMSYAQDAIDLADSAGMDTSELSDTWAKFFPRSIEEPVQRGVMGYIEKARTSKQLKRKADASKDNVRTTTENLNPISRRMTQRRKYLQNIFGGTNTLNYFYTKFGGDRIQRVIGTQVAKDTPLLTVIKQITEDDHWFIAARNKEYADQLIEEGVLVKVELDSSGNPTKLPVDMDGKTVEIFPVEYETFGGIDPPLKQAVYVNKDSDGIAHLAESILDKSDSLGEGQKLFSTDPIRSMIGYYGDVIKASVAADTVLDLASENAYFSMLRSLEDTTGNLEGSAHTVNSILRNGKLDTLIGKRKFIDRLRAERPDQWDELMRMWTDPIETLEVSQQVAMQETRNNFPDLAQFLKKLQSDPDNIDISIGDEVRRQVGGGGGDSQTYKVQGKNLYKDGELVVSGSDELLPVDNVPTGVAPEVDPNSLARSAGVEPDDLSSVKPEPIPEHMQDAWSEVERVLGPKAGGYDQSDVGWYRVKKIDLEVAGEENIEARLRELYSERTPAAPAPVSATQQVDNILQGSAPYSRPDVDLENDILRGGTAPVGGVACGDKKNGLYLLLEGLEGDHPIQEFVQKHYIPNSILHNKDKLYKGHTMSDALLGNFHIEAELSDDLRRYLNSFTKRDITNEFLAVGDWFTDVFKDMATSLWPAFHSRNFLSGQVNNMYSGAYDPRHAGPKKWIQPVMDAMAIAEGKTITGLMELDVFKAMKGIDTDEQATQYIIDLAMGHGLIGPGQHLSDLQEVASGTAQNFLERVGGPNPIIREAPATGALDVLKNYASGFGGRINQSRKLGDEVVGEVLGKTIPGLTNSRGARAGVGYKRMGFQLGNEVEFLNRISPLVAHIRKGLSPEEAILKVKLAQVDYKALTPWEKQFMKRVIPFYTFTRRQVPFVVENMLDPSGSMASTAKFMFRAKNAMEDEEEPVPDYISTNINLPLHKLGLGATTEGQARYLTGLGGFIGGLEDVSGLLKPGHGPMDTAGRTISGLMARANPLGQAVVETGTGVSLFHQRPYADMKSPTARLLGEVTGSEFVPKYPSAQLDMLLHKLPGYGRSVSTARTLTDSTRKPLFDEGGNFSAANFLARTVPVALGARITEVPMDRIKNRLLQNRLEELLSNNPSMVKFSQIYIPSDKMGALSQEEREAYMLYKKLGSQAAKASYARKRAAEYSN
jgi:hypothetical protein